ncbi:MAG: PAS domain-containing protein [Paracoccaceae bacterium]
MKGSKVRSIPDLTSVLLLRDIEVPVWVVDERSSHFLWANRAALRFWGQDSLEALVAAGPMANKFADKVDWQDLIAEVGEDAPVARSLVLLPEGDSKCVDAALERIRIDGHGLAVVVELRAVANDCSDDIRSKHWLKAFFDDSPFEFGIKDINGRYILANERLATYFGKRIEDLIGKTTEEAFPQNSVRQIVDQDEDVLRSGTEIITHISHYEEGRDQPFHVTKFPIRDASGEVIGLGGVAHDLSEQLSLEASLRQTEGILATALEALPVGVAVFDKDARLEVFNSKYKALLPRTEHIVRKGVTFEDLCRNSMQSVSQKLGYDDPESYLRDRLEASRQIGTTWTYRQGSGLWINMVEHPTKTGGFVSVVTDITDFKMQQEALDHALRLQAMGQLTGGVAHDFNNLLAVIQGNVELLQLESNNGDEFLAAILSAVQKGARLTSNLLAFARKQVLKPEQVDLRVAMPEFFEILHRSLGEAISINATLDPDLWYVFVDLGQLENALLNLALNGRDSMPEGGNLSVSFQNRSFSAACAELPPNLKPGDYVEIAIEDSGTGIRPDDIKKCLEPFYTTKEIGKGSGLGLSMAFGFAQQSGGVLTLDSELCHGTTVSVFLPRSPSQKSLDVSKRGISLPRGDGETVLVVEDNPDLLRLCHTILSRLGYLPLTAKDATEAARELKRSDTVDLVLSDVGLPGEHSGYEFADRVRQEQPGVKFVFMSGYPDEYSLQKGPPEGDVLLTKPFTQQELALTVRKALNVSD